MATPDTVLYRRINTATTIYFALTLPTTTGYPASTFGSQSAAGATFAAGDVRYSIDGAAFANTTNLPTDETDGFFSLALVAAETNGSVICIAIKDQTATRVWEDKFVIIETTLQLGSVVVNNPSGDALTLTSSGSNGSGLACAGNGSGEGIKATGGATGNGIEGVGGATSGSGIAGTASAGNSVGIAGAGQGTGAGLQGTGGANGHGINAAAQGTGTGFNTTAAATSLYTTIFNQTEAAEPTTAIANLASIGAILQHLKRRFTNKVTQTSTTQTVYRDDSSTVLESMAVSDDGTTQTKGKSA